MIHLWKAGDVVLLVEDLPTTQTPWVWPLAPYKPIMVAHTWNSRASEIEARRPEVQCRSILLHSEMKASLDYMRLSKM